MASSIKAGLRKLNKKFDIIESVGVLHHMADPLMGWASLTDCLKKDGYFIYVSS